MRKQALLLFIIIQLPILLAAQQDKTGNWLMYFGQNRGE